MQRYTIAKPQVSVWTSPLCPFAAILAFVPPALADVHFGKNVRIGGSDVSNQTFTKKRRGLYFIYNQAPPHPGQRPFGFGQDYTEWFRSDRHIGVNVHGHAVVVVQIRRFYFAWDNIQFELRYVETINKKADQ